MKGIQVQQYILKKIPEIIQNQKTETQDLDPEESIETLANFSHKKITENNDDYIHSCFKVINHIYTSGDDHIREEVLRKFISPLHSYLKSYPRKKQDEILSLLNIELLNSYVYNKFELS